MSKMSLSYRILTRVMRVFFYLLYQPMAWSYDGIAALVSWGRWKAWVLTVLPHLKGPRVLEMGHGPGHLQVALHQKGIPACGIDASRQMGQQARKRLYRQAYTPDLVRGYAQNLPFPTAYFDQIVATFPSEYIYAPETLAEVQRTLKPGGIFVVLPVAWITGRSLPDRVTAGLFRITGQAPKWDPRWLAPFSKVGFQPRIETITRTTWKLIIILAYKPF